MNTMFRIRNAGGGAWNAVLSGATAGHLRAAGSKRELRTRLERANVELTQLKEELSRLKYELTRSDVAYEAALEQGETDARMERNFGYAWGYNEGHDDGRAEGNLEVQDWISLVKGVAHTRVMEPEEIRSLIPISLKNALDRRDDG